MPPIPSPLSFPLALLFMSMALMCHFKSGKQKPRNLCGLLERSMNMCHITVLNLTLILFILTHSLMDCKVKEEDTVTAVINLVWQQNQTHIFLLMMLPFDSTTLKSDFLLNHCPYNTPFYHNALYIFVCVYRHIHIECHVLSGSTEQNVLLLEGVVSMRVADPGRAH